MSRTALGVALLAATALTWSPLAAQPGTRGSSRALSELVTTTTDGETLRGEDLLGSFVLLDFWATWCAPCLEELPHLRRLHEEFGGAGFEVVGVSVDEMGRAGLKSWLLRQRVGWPQVHDGRGFDGALALRYGVDAVPSTFLYDRKGRLLGGDVALEEVEAILRATLGPDAAP